MRSTLPQTVQKTTALRVKWTVAETGAKTLSYPDMAWLSFRDAIAVLRELPKDKWRSCMASEPRRRTTFQRLLRSAKRLRDQHVAHPQTHYPTARELKRVLYAVNLTRTSRNQKGTRESDFQKLPVTC